MVGRTPQSFWVRRSVLLINSLSLILGLTCVIAATALSRQAIAATVLSLIGGAFVSASVVTLILGAATVRETTAQIDSALLRGLQDVLEPVRLPLYAGALSSYRYDCLLSAPLAQDDRPDHAYQSIRISYRIDSLASDLGIVCAASRDDEAVRDFTGPEYALRWMIDDDLDPVNPKIFNLGLVAVDQQPLSRRSDTTSQVAGGTARVIQFAVPHRIRTTAGHLVEIQFTARKFVGADRRIRIQSSLFRAATDAEYRLTVDPGLKVTRMHVTASEISALGASQAASVGPMYVGPFGALSGIARLPFPLQPGSTIAFLLDRDP